jgi:phosphoglycolate phosphatase
MNMLAGVRCVLFDLDGTLVDTAPDMVAALNRLRETEGLKPMAQALLRNQVSHGAVGLLAAGMPATDADTHEAWRLRFLDLYQQDLCVESRLFPGMERVLEVIESSQRSWGVVTNKPGWLATPLLESLSLSSRLACMVPGDALKRRKPHPDPIFRACELTGCTPPESVYVGDAERDIQAARAANCPSVVAAYGYIEDSESPQLWGADLLVHSANELADLLRQVPLEVR